MRSAQAAASAANASAARAALAPARVDDLAERLHAMLAVQRAVLCCLAVVPALCACDLEQMQARLDALEFEAV